MCYGMKKDADNLIYNLNVERDEKAKDQMECNRLRDGVAMKERDCQDNDGRIKAVDYDLYKAQERCGDLTKLADQRSIELKRMQEALACSSAENARARDDQSRLMAEVQGLQRNLDGQLANKNDLNRQADVEDNRNRQFSSDMLAYE